MRAPERNRHGYIEDRTRLAGDLIIVMPEIECFREDIATHRSSAAYSNSR